MEWIDVKFSDFLKERRGKYKPSDATIKDLMRIEKIDFSGQIYLSNKPSKTDMILVKDGDLVISGINVEKGAMNIYQGNEDVIATIHYSSYTYDTNIIDLEFLKHYLKSKKFKDILKEQVPGGIKTEIKPKHLLPLKIQIPKTLEYQRRIVSHLDNLYDDSTKTSSEINRQFDLIKDLRQAFLREAMQGTLVSNKTTDGKTGADLLAEIHTEKAKLIKEKKIKKGKPLAPIAEEDIPFDIPENWTWCRLGELCESIVYGTSKSSDYDISKNSKILRIPNISSGIINNTDLKYTNLELKEINNLSLKEDDILTIRSNGSKFLVGIFVKVPREYENYCYAGYLIRLRLFSNFIKSSFIALNSKTSYFRNLIELPLRTTVGINNINTEELSNLVVPLPPLEIQERIVAKLDELMDYCDQLETQVKESQKTNELLLQQVLREALEGKLQEESVEEEVGDYQVVVDSVFGTVDKVQSINNSDLEDAALVYLMKSNLGYSYGEVALQKAKYNSSYMTPNLYSKQYAFVNHHFGTYSDELRVDLQMNPYLIRKKENGKEVYAINPSKEKEVLDVITNKENKGFVTAINELMQIYSLPFIGKKTDMMELFNTVLKIYADLKTTDINIIYQSMKDWKIKQIGFKTKAEKFSKEDTEKMIELLLSRGVIK